MTGGITDGIGGRIRGLAARKTAPALEPMLLWADTNYEEAVKWYRKAAEQGYAGAQFELAGCYAEGKGVANN